MALKQYSTERLERELAGTQGALRAMIQVALDLRKQVALLQEELILETAQSALPHPSDQHLQQSSEPQQLRERPLQALLQTYHTPVLSRPLER